jgi:hypothetical protein
MAKGRMREGASVSQTSPALFLKHLNGVSICERAPRADAEVREESRLVRRVNPRFTMRPTRASAPQMNSHLVGGGRRKPPLFGTGAPVRRPKGLSRALAAFSGAQSAPLTDLSAGAFQSPFQTMAARGVGVRFQRASAIQFANPMRWAATRSMMLLCLVATMHSTTSGVERGVGLAQSAHAPHFGGPALHVSQSAMIAWASLPPT